MGGMFHFSRKSKEDIDIVKWREILERISKIAIPESVANEYDIKISPLEGNEEAAFLFQEKMNVDAPYPCQETPIRIKLCGNSPIISMAKWHGGFTWKE
jgi:hypothetical protein